MKTSVTIDKECKKHGLMEHVQEVGGYFRCKRCRNDHVIARRRAVKLQLIEEFGGKCSICGYNKCRNSLVFHHIDPSKKDFSISYKGKTASINTLRNEARKCKLVCANCHGELHEKNDLNIGG